MYISTVAGAAVAVLVPLAVRADVKLTNNLYKDINAGEPFTLTWSGDESPVKIILESGPSTDLTPVATLAASATGSKATVSIPSTLSSGNYAFAIKQSGITNYSPQFPIEGLTIPSSASASFTTGSPSPSSTKRKMQYATPISPASATAYYPIGSAGAYGYGGSNMTYPTTASGSGVGTLATAGASGTGIAKGSGSGGFGPSSSIVPFINGAAAGRTGQSMGTVGMACRLVVVAVLGGLWIGGAGVGVV